jgi:hypothetical protein
MAASTHFRIQRDAIMWRNDALCWGYAQPNAHKELEQKGENKQELISAKHMRRSEEHKENINMR